jgi:hypothetical protein
MKKKLLRFFSSVKLTVWCLGLGMILVFVGTLAQVEQGLIPGPGSLLQELVRALVPGGRGLEHPGVSGRVLNRGGIGD